MSQNFDTHYAKNELLPVLAVLLSTIFFTPLAGANVTEEIVVTAQKRVESLQDVPLAISVFDEDFVRTHQTTSFKDLIEYTPGFTGSTPDGFLDSVSVRGISSNSFGTGVEPSVGIFLDGVYQSRAGTIPTLIDVARVEMVKGPQGTLFGRNTSSGAVNIISNEPHDEYGANVDFGIGEYGRLYGFASLNVPVTENFFARAAFLKEKENGFVKNQIDHRELGAFDINAGRIAVKYQGFERIELDLSTYYEDRDQFGALYRALDTPGPYDKIQSDLSDGEKDESEIFGITGRINIDVFGGVLTSTTAYKESNYTYIEDFDGSADLIDHFGRDQEQDLWSQEVRFVSAVGERFRWFAGGNYYRENVQATFFDRTDEELQCQTYLEDSCANGLAPDPFTASPDGLFESSVADGEYSGWGIFAEVTWSITDRVDITAGGRYTHDERKFSLFVPEPDSDLGAFYIYGFFTNEPLSDEADWDNFSPRFLLEYAFSDDVNLFASYSQGYKAGGYDNFTVVGNDFSGVALGADAQLATFDEEKVESYEIGIKSEFFDNRLRFNASGYFYEYTDLQETFFVGPITVTGNVGEAEGIGFETDVTIFPHEYWELIFNFSYMDTEVSGVPDDLCENCEGNELPFAPEVSLSALVNFNYPVPYGEFFVSAEFVYVDEQFYDLDNTQEIINGAYDTTDFRFGLRSPNRRWKGSVYVKNAFDEEYYLWGFAAEDAIPATQLDPSQGRAIGVELSFEY